MENRREIREETAAAEQATEQRAGFSSALSVQLVKDGGVAASSERGKSSLVVRMRGDEQVILWDRFLPRRLLSVLLVENDQSTRHIVTAMLRKCSYQVAAVADGLKAWDALKEKHYNFDLVLTEMVMPSLSGFGLLSKMMNNEMCKNIPVVMMSSHNSTTMSSHDSLGIVFKCMLNGAADFLLKPVRNNELRNLWQHVWRKYHATLETVSDNIAPINHGSSNTDKGSRTGGGSDNESDSQRSFSNLEEKNGGALKLRENSEGENGNFVQEIDLESTKLECDKATGEEMNVSLSIHVANSTQNILKANGFYNESPCSEEYRASSRSRDGSIIDFELLDQIGRTNEPSKEIIDFIGATIIEQNKFPILEHKDHAEDIFCKNEKSSVEKRSTLNSGSSQSWKLSLWGPQLEFNDDEVFQEEHVLNHSHASDFSRYGGGKIHVTGASGSNVCNDDTSVVIKTGTALDSGNGNDFQDGNGEGLDNSCSRRQAALIRFRLKRKDRCFIKKVRYQGRQKLAEQRPRLKGRFVRQANQPDCFRIG
ncbi:two-component response regulator-like PRR95 isoform X2 [Macadamia integrifolia]|uniref:two-component response regulator-like PRR95 isoform X2 n=1 Tax=Macadamia integrifolia TaxID=60698 RepID=UPI001C52EA92|nr:two-component response regulator-like PRR95 isoform X2 [Macadamia integrifolia]